jgi:hypothetical protein
VRETSPLRQSPVRDSPGRQSPTHKRAIWVTFSLTSSPAHKPLLS